MRRICGGMPVNSGVYYVLFQGRYVCANAIIPLGMSLKIGDASKGHFSWSMALHFLLWKKIAKQHIIKLFVLVDMELYIGRLVSKN